MHTNIIRYAVSIQITSAHPSLCALQYTPHNIAVYEMNPFTIFANLINICSLINKYTCHK